MRNLKGSGVLKELIEALDSMCQCCKYYDSCRRVGFMPCGYYKNIVDLVIEDEEEDYDWTPAYSILTKKEDEK